MSTRSALAGAFTTAALVAALGSPAAVEAGRDAESRTLGLTLTAFADWDVAGLPGEVVGGVALRLVVALVLVTLLCALAGRSRSRAAAFVAGWGALVVAAAVAAAAASAYDAGVVLDRRMSGPSFVDRIVGSTNDAAAFGLWTGWLVGVAVAVATRPAPATAGVPEYAARATAIPASSGSPAPSRHIAEPPPPWWAPTRSGESGGALRPGPSVFLPGGAHAPGAPGALAGTGGGTADPPSGRQAGPPPVVPEATYEMSTASGDPHPSDPDATRPIGMPSPGDDATRPNGTADTGDDQGADATTTMEADDSDTTRTMDATDPLHRRDT
jgi:hypothetical protein